MLTSGTEIASRASSAVVSSEYDSNQPSSKSQWYPSSVTTSLAIAVKAVANINIVVADQIT